MSKSKEIVCRFAPSPTGPLHVGGVRSALFNFLFAKQQGGKIILRIEDTDKERSKKEYEDDILEGFKWLGLSFDETHRQSQRASEHTKILQQLIDKGAAYVSKEKVEKEGDRAEVIRFKNPNRTIAFEDIIKGRIEFNTTELGDFVIAKSLSEPLFHLAVVADDAAMGITHVIRGEDHISNTPRQILIQEAIGAPQPIYGHIPLLLATDKSKLSKRKHGESVSLKFYREQGYLPQALLNYLALLGWNPGNEQELFSLDDLIKEFKLEKVQKSNAIFNVEKLNWMNKHYLAKESRESAIRKISDKLKENGTLSKLTPAQLTKLSGIVLERVSYYGEAKALADTKEFNYLAENPSYKAESLLWSKHPDKEIAHKHISYVMDVLEKTPEEISAQTAQSAIFPYAEKEGKGDVLWPVRFALSGKERSIDPFNLIAILGKKESLSRLQAALHLLK